MSFFDLFNLSKKKKAKVEEAFQQQEEYEEIVEIDEEGRVYKPGEAPRSPGRKPTVLRDPQGEFSFVECCHVSISS